MTLFCSRVTTGLPVVVTLFPHGPRVAAAAAEEEEEEIPVFKSYLLFYGLLRSLLCFCRTPLVLVQGLCDKSSPIRQGRNERKWKRNTSRLEDVGMGWAGEEVVRPIDSVLIEAADGSMGWHESKAAKREWMTRQKGNLKVEHASNVLCSASLYRQESTRKALLFSLSLSLSRSLSSRAMLGSALAQLHFGSVPFVDYAIPLLLQQQQQQSYWSNDSLSSSSSVYGFWSRFLCWLIGRDTPVQLSCSAMSTAIAPAVCVCVVFTARVCFCFVVPEKRLY